MRDARMEKVSAEDIARELLNRVRSDVAWARIGVSEYEEADGLIRLMERTLADAQEVMRHGCEWSENDICVVCGADGRA